VHWRSWLQHLVMLENIPVLPAIQLEWLTNTLHLLCKVRSRRISKIIKSSDE